MATPEEFISNIISNALATANDFVREVDDIARQVSNASGGQYVPQPSTEQDFLVEAIEPEIPTANDTSLIFEAQMYNIEALLKAKVAEFISTYYPLSASYDGAEGKLIDLISNNGLGFNYDFEVPSIGSLQTNDSTDTTLAVALTDTHMRGGTSLPVATHMTKGSLVSDSSLGDIDTNLDNIGIDNIVTTIDVSTALDLSDLTSSGVGVDPGSFDQVWQRARERIMSDGRRTEGQIVEGFAAKGYVLPSGQMLKMVNESRASQLFATGAAATDIAAKQVAFALEIAKLAKEINDRRHSFELDQMKLEADIRGQEIGFEIEIAKIKVSADLSWKQIGYDITLATKKADLEIEVAKLDLERLRLNADIESKEINFNLDIASKQVEFDIERAKLGTGTARIELERKTKEVEFKMSVSEKNSKFDIDKERLIAERSELDLKRVMLDAEIYKVDVDTIRFAIEKALNSRKDALTAAGDYVRTMTAAPDTAVKVAALNSDVQAKMMSAASDFYRARLGRDELILKSKLAKIDSDVEVHKIEQGTSIDINKTKVQALGTAADAYARTATAALSSLNSIISTGVSAFA